MRHSYLSPLSAPAPHPSPRARPRLRSCGYQLHELKEAGFTLTELKELKRPGNGGQDVAYTLQDFMKLGYSCIECKKAGYPLSALKSGYSEACLKVTHFTTKAELAEDGFPLQHLKLAGFSAFELRDAGFKVSALMKMGFSHADQKSLAGPGSVSTKRFW